VCVFCLMVPNSVTIQLISNHLPLYMCVRACVALILFSVFRALGRECPHEFLRRLRDLLPWEEVSYGGLPP
jgi:hypothetical protein